MGSPPASPVTIVTGSSRGIGLAIARALARDGHRLVLVARAADRLAAVAADLTGRGAAVATVAVDLRLPDAVPHVVACAERAFGPPDAVVNNAGTAPADKLENTTPDVLQETFDLHVALPLRFARAVVPGMRQRGTGALLQIASTAGLRAFPFTSAYSAAKHGMVGLSRALGAELARTGITVYALCPGYVDSDITRQAAAAVAARGRTSAEVAFARMAEQNLIGRMHTTDEVAAAAAMLLRDRPRGTVYDLDRNPPAFVDGPTHP